MTHTQIHTDTHRYRQAHTHTETQTGARTHTHTLSLSLLPLPGFTARKKTFEYITAASVHQRGVFSWYLIFGWME